MKKYVLESYMDLRETPAAIWDITNGKPGSGAQLVWDLRKNGMTHELAAKVVSILNDEAKEWVSLTRTGGVMNENIGAIASIVEPLKHRLFYVALILNFIFAAGICLLFPRGSTAVALIIWVSTIGGWIWARP